MNEDDLIDDLRDGMRLQTAATAVPDGFADRARRTARRRLARRAAAAGTPLLAIAAVAAVVATSAGSGSSAPTSNVTVGGGQAHDTAYIVKRVKARLADDSSESVWHVYEVPGGSEASSGALANLGRHSFDQYVYDTPAGDQYQRTVDHNQAGNPTQVAFWKIYTAADGEQTLAATRINPATHTYTTSQAPTGGGATSGAQLPDGPPAVQQALQSGQVTQIGTTTIDGTPAIALALKEVHVGSRTLPVTPTNYSETLYVDARTYQLLRTVDANHDHNPHFFRGLYVSDLLPATPANIARAENESIPAGYTKG